jgi:hypothetical protein
MGLEKIRNLTFSEAKEMALENISIKDHDCLFVNLGHDFFDFGYSVIVYKNGKQIYYANDYEIYHRFLINKQGIEALREYYIQEMNNKLFTDAELLEEIKTYDEYKRKNYFLLNLWIGRFEYVSACYIGDEGKKKLIKEKIKFPYFNPVSLCYVSDKNIIDQSVKYLRHLEKSYKQLQNNTDFFRSMIRTELVNHEACITCSSSEALSALGLNYNDLSQRQKEIVQEELSKQIENMILFNSDN